MRSTVPSGRDADGSDDGKVVKEMERLALVSSESLDDLRHRLLVYRAGDLWFPAGGIPKQETDIPLVITVLLLGFAGSGKSSLVNLMYSVLGRAEIVPFAHTSSPADKNRHRILTFKTMVVRCFTASNDMDHCSPNFKIDASASFLFPFKSHAMEAYSSHMLLIKSSKCCKGVFCSESVAERLHVEKNLVHVKLMEGSMLERCRELASILSVRWSFSAISASLFASFFPTWFAPSIYFKYCFNKQPVSEQFIGWPLFGYALNL